VLLIGAAIIGGVLASLFAERLGLVGTVLEVIVVAVFLAQKSLADHVEAVARGLRNGGLAGGRMAVSMIVGRDPRRLMNPVSHAQRLRAWRRISPTELSHRRSGMHSSDLPGLLAYKMLNTADSMIGHLNERHRDFGRAAARLDDFANWPAARLSALLIAAGAGLSRGVPAMRRAAETALTDSGLHRSPNAGWPEAAMAGATGLALAGPRQYGGELVMEASLHAAGHRQAGSVDIVSALRVFLRACDSLVVLVALLLLVVF
jgi:adenosylcobinamide-phosphate synthase